MKKLIRKGLLFAVIIMVPYAALQRYVITHYDHNYPKLTDQHQALITGLSREKRGISPDILQEEFGMSYTPQNLAFNSATSPYGPYYYSFLERKYLDTRAPDNFHLIGVSPVSVMNIRDSLMDGRESFDLIYKLHSVTDEPNLEYLLRKPALKVLYKEATDSFFRRAKREVHVHDNGWVEINMAQGHRRTQGPVSRSYSVSARRIRYLQKTIDMLSKTGRVFLIRMPVSHDVLQFEEGIYPGFDRAMHQIASEKSTPYLNYATRNLSYEFSDKPGHHLTGKSAKEFTHLLSKDIRAFLSDR